MGKKRIGKKELRARQIKKEIKQLDKKGYDAALATEGKSIEEISRSQKSYERFKERKKVARERQKVEAVVAEIKQRFKEQRKIIETKRREREKWERYNKYINKEKEEPVKKDLKDLKVKREDSIIKEIEKEKELEVVDFGLEIEEEIKMKEYLTNMLTTRMDGVSDELVKKVRDIIYNADIMQLDRISDFFPSWDAFKEFYTSSDENVYGASTVDEKTELLEELVRFIER